MRITFTPREGGDCREKIIPLDYRRHFISFIKTISRDSSLFSRFEEEKPGYSPCVFSVGFAQISAIEPQKRQMVIRPPVFMTVATGIFEVMTALCNGAIKSKGRESVLGLVVRDIQMLPYKKIRSRSVLFKIAGHAVLRGREGYLDGDDLDELEEALNTHLRARIQFLKGRYREGVFPDGCHPVKITSSGIKKGVCFHYGGLLTTVQGSMELEGEPSALQFLHDFGMGVRTGQGFGLLEVMSGT